MTELDMFMQHVESSLDDIVKKLDIVISNTTKKPKKTGEKKQTDMLLETQFEEVLAYWNEKFGKNLKKSKCHRDPIIARLKEGFTVDEFKTVIGNKIDDPWFKKTPRYFLPSTLFGTKMDTYLNCGVCRDVEPEQEALNAYQDDLLRGMEDNGL